MGVLSALKKKLAGKPDKSVGTTEKKKKKNKYIVYIAEKNNIPYSQAKAMMDEAKVKFADHDLNYRGYVKNHLDELDEAGQLKAIKAAEKKAERTKERSINNLMNVTGQSREEVLERLDYVKETFGLGPKAYYGRMYYSMTDDEIREDMENRKITEAKYVTLCAERSGKTESEIRKHMFRVSNLYSMDSHDYLLFNAWRHTDEELAEFLTIKHSRKMPVKYNERDKGIITADKILFNKVFKDYTNRKFWVNEDTSYEEFCEFIDGLEYIFAKPINLCQGRGARKIVLSEVEDTRVLYDELMAEPKMLIEEGVIQHPVMRAVHPNSINTVRTFCLQKDGECHVLAAFVRFGLNGSVVDNMVAGGSIAGVDEKTGIIETPIIDREGNAYEVHPNTGIRVLGMQIPMWDEILEISKKALQHVDGLNYLGWDIAITEKGPVMIEANTMPGMGAYQTGYAYYGKGMLYKFKDYM